MEKWVTITWVDTVISIISEVIPSIRDRLLSPVILSEVSTVRLSKVRLPARLR